MEKEATVKKFVTSITVAVALAVGVGTAAAAGGADVQTRTVGFVLSSATCAHLESGTSITGTGTEKSITVTRTDRDGVTTVANSTHTHGTAVDQDGNTYVFSYSNQFRITNTLADPAVFSGTMNDAFSLAGGGHAARLSNGFRADVTFEFDQAGQIVGASFDPLQARGDPIDFVTGASLCDPL